jgi:diguanylate cyclase (GGDEF)-like protein
MIKKDIIDYIKKDGKHSISAAVKTAKRILNNYDTTVLIVDDSQTQLGILKEILLKLKLNVLTAHNGVEALEIIQTHPSKISLILTDYNMDKMDGMELVFNLRDTYGKDELGIIVLSASDSFEIPIQFLRIGSNDYITKPYNEIEVITRVNSNLETLELFQQTKDLANKDFLTGLYNRRFFFEYGNKIFEKAQRKNEHLAVVMCDIDKFKSINDTYGHDVGDVAICEVARILSTSLRSTDLIARFGGEEFCIVLEKMSLTQTQNLLETIRAKFESNQLSVGDISLNFTASLGVCYGLRSDLESMIKSADEALYFCKNNGRNQVKIELYMA